MHLECKNEWCNQVLTIWFMFHFTGLSNLETMSNECYGSVTVKLNSIFFFFFCLATYIQLIHHYTSTITSQDKEVVKNKP